MQAVGGKLYLTGLDDDLADQLDRSLDQVILPGVRGCGALTGFEIDIGIEHDQHNPGIVVLVGEGLGMIGRKKDIPLGDANASDEFHHPVLLIEDDLLGDDLDGSFGCILRTEGHLHAQ